MYLYNFFSTICIEQLTCMDIYVRKCQIYFFVILINRSRWNFVARGQLPTISSLQISICPVVTYSLMTADENLFPLWGLYWKYFSHERSACDISRRKRRASMVYSGFIHTSWLPQTLRRKKITEYFNQSDMLLHRTLNVRKNSAHAWSGLRSLDAEFAETEW